ncbi:FecR domain-containing protein [Alistipes sp. OttesenSCG-928-B03]|nr:FecR domain-containing protein [Alistipes sp. OttesenSCG-928-B03]
MSELPINNDVNDSGDQALERGLRILASMDNVDTDKLRARIYDTVGRRKRRNRTVAIVRRCAAAAVPLLLAGAAWLYYSNRPQAETVTYAASTESGTAIVADNLLTTIYVPPTYGFMAEYDWSDPVAVVAAPEEETETKPATTTAELYQVYNTLNVPNGNMYNIYLADGTSVWLNSSSQLKYPAAFVGAERRVYLEGEAYFDVTHDPDKPFVVETARQELRVLGTEFNVSAYREDPRVYTTLSEGMVALRSHGSDAETILLPGQQACLNPESSEFTIRAVNADELISWKSGIFVFEGGTLEQAMCKLSRWYDMEYTFEYESMRRMVLRGSMPVQADISTVLSLLEVSGNVKFTVTDNTIKISAN